jgi:hypothetical protein
MLAPSGNRLVFRGRAPSVVLDSGDRAFANFERKEVTDELSG